MGFALAVSALGLSSSARADDARDKAIAFVHKLGGDVTRDQKAPGKPGVEVNLSNTEVTDAGRKELAALPNLTTLDLFGTRVTDAGLKELAALPNLTALRLSNTTVTDAGVKELAPLKSLTALDLPYGVTDAGLKELKKALPKCNITK